MKVLILGVSGMLGHAMFRTLAELDRLDVHGTVRSDSNRAFFPAPLRERLLSGVDAEATDHLTQVILDSKPDVVINCIGIVKQLVSDGNLLPILTLNAVLPHRLAALCCDNGIRFVHISTDCVFSGTRGNYTEADVSDAEDFYGRTKFLGECHYPNTVTIRTSMIGHELSSAHGLLDWFLRQTTRVQGYSNAVFSGLTTIELAHVIRDIILPRDGLSGLYHVASKPITKLDLLRLVARVYEKNIAIVPDAALKVDRSLNADRFHEATGYVAPSWLEMVTHMRECQQASGSSSTIAS